MKIAFKLKNDTEAYYLFAARNKPYLITLYLKKKQVDEAGIDPQKGIIITVEEDNNNG